MQKFEIVINLEHIAQAKARAVETNREFLSRVDRAMTRLIHEAAAQRMSVNEVGKLSGFTTAQIKSRMKAMGLNPTTGKTLLSKQAAGVLESNAEIMGIEPHEIDLMSPLMYLPAGPGLKHPTADVHSIDEKSFLETAVEVMKERGFCRFHINGEAYEIRVEALWADRERWALDVDSLALLAQADEVGA